MDSLQLTRCDDGTAVVHINEPEEKVNKLSARFISQFEEILGTLESDSSVKGLILISDKADNFTVGADLKEFLSLSDPKTAEGIVTRVHGLFYHLEALPFPVLAAIHGACLGGGLELALACHFRIATDHPKTVLGLPEVKLGLLPAAGGTQRLTELIGIRKALPLMLEGRTVNARNAKALGIVDAIVYPHELMQTARKYMGYLKDKPRNGLRKTHYLSTEGVLRKLQPVAKLYFNVVRRTVEKRTHGNFPAPFKIIDCVETGIRVGFAAGLKAEAKSFGELVLSSESMALRQLFFAVTALKKNPLAKAAHPVDHVAVLGSGLMGSGIAAVSAKGELPVVLKDVSWENLSKGLKNIWEYLDRQVRRNRQNRVERDRLYSLVSPVTSYERFSDAKVVIEAVYEDLALKQRVLKEAEEHICPECIFASNTSAIPISRIASASRRPENVIGMHYFSPVPRMPLLEIVVTPQTAPWVTATAISLGRRQGKTVIVVKDGPGFYTSRILSAFLHEAMAMLKEGADIRQIDETIRQFGFPIGPFKLLDEVGIDVGTHVSREVHEVFEPRGFDPPLILQRFLDDGILGRKSGAGFYQYDHSNWMAKLPLPHFNKQRPVNTAIYKYFGGDNRKLFDVLEIQERLVLMMVNEAVICLQEGILDRPLDGDVGAILGLGFPPFLGGPFRYLDRLGPNEAVIKLERLADKFGPRFQPASLLSDLAVRGETFYKED